MTSRRKHHTRCGNGSQRVENGPREAKKWAETGNGTPKQVTLGPTTRVKMAKLVRVKVTEKMSQKLATGPGPTRATRGSQGTYPWGPTKKSKVRPIRENNDSCAPLRPKLVFLSKDHIKIAHHLDFMWSSKNVHGFVKANSRNSREGMSLGYIRG